MRTAACVTGVHLAKYALTFTDSFKGSRDTYPHLLNEETGVQRLGNMIHSQQVEQQKQKLNFS